MQFASPTSLLWLSLAVPIVILYILKIRMRRVPVSTVMFWNQIFDEKKPRSIWQRLRHLISLLLQLAFLALLVFAVADPFFAWEKRDVRSIVLIVDNSASMAAKTGATTHLTEAKRRGERLVRGLRIRDQLAVVSAGTTPKVESGLTNHQRTLREALNAIPATDGPTRVLAAVAMARRLLAGHENPQIVILSDGCFAGAEKLVGDDTVQFDVIGKPADNVAITQFQVRRSLIDVVGYQILVEVTSFSEQTTECRLEVTLEDDLVDVIPLTLEPNQPHRQVLDHTSNSGGRMVAKLDVEDALSTDNQAMAILPTRVRQAVVLVTDGNLFLQSALNAIPLVELETVTELPDSVPSSTIVVFDGKTPDKLPAGNVFVVQPTGASDYWDLGPPIQDPIVTGQDKDSTLLTHVQLENVLMPDARTLDIKGEHQVLASSIGGEPLYVLIDRPEGKVLVITVDLKKGDLPLRTAFPIMITNAINWYRGERAELQQALATGAIVECPLGSDEDPEPDARTSTPSTTEPVAEVMTGASSIVLRGPDGSDNPLPGAVDPLTLGPLDQSGLWQVVRAEPNPTSSSATDRLQTVIAEYACNLANAEESNLRPAAELSNPTAVYAGALGGRPIWFYLIVVALLLTTVEWFMYQRRWIS